MTQTEEPSTTPSSPRSPRQSRVQRAIAYLWSEWRVELFIVLVILIGIFLLVERMQIRQTVMDWLQWGFTTLKDSGTTIQKELSRFVQKTTISDLLGYSLLLLALGFIIWRIRWRLMTLPRFTEPQCPRCGGDLHRIHRHRRDRMLDLFVPVRRYRCKSPDCRWQGLRTKRSRYE